MRLSEWNMIRLDREVFGHLKTMMGTAEEGRRHNANVLQMHHVLPMSRKNKPRKFACILWTEEMPDRCLCTRYQGLVLNVAEIEG